MNVSRENLENQIINKLISTWKNINSTDNLDYYEIKVCESSL